MVRSKSVTRGNYGEIRRHIINNGSRSAMIKYGFSANYASWIGQSPTFDDFIKLRTEKYKQYQSKYRNKHETTPSSDVGNRIHFSPQLPLSSPFADKQKTQTVSNGTPLSTFKDTAEFTSDQLRIACTMAEKGEFMKDIASAVGLTIGVLYNKFSCDKEAKQIFYKYFDLGNELRKQRANTRRVKGINRANKIRQEVQAESVKKYNRSSGQKAYWDSLTDEERKARLTAMRESRARTNARKKGLIGGDVQEVKQEDQVVGDQAPREEVQIAEKAETPQVQVVVKDNNLIGAIEVHKSAKGRTRFVGFALSALFMTGILAVMKLCGMLDITWSTVMFPLLVEVGIELLVVFALGLMLSIRVVQLPSGVKLVYKDYRKDK